MATASTALPPIDETAPSTARLVHLVSSDRPLRTLVEESLRSIGVPCKCWEAPEELLKTIVQQPAGLLLIDARIRGMSGLHLFRTLRSAGVVAPAIFLAGVEDFPAAIETLRQGAADLLPKPIAPQALADSVQRVLKEAEAHARQRAIEQDVRGRIARLSHREHDVFLRLIVGKTNKKTAAELGLSDKTVEEYRSKVMSKLRAVSVADLVKMAVVGGETDPYDFSDRPH